MLRFRQQIAGDWMAREGVMKNLDLSRPRLIAVRPEPSILIAGDV